jgi:hypothetical protein
VECKVKLREPKWICSQEADEWRIVEVGAAKAVTPTHSCLTVGVT